MKTAELEHELRFALQAMTSERAAQLCRAGIDVLVPIGLSRVIVEGERYSPYCDDTTKFAFILPVLVDHPHTPESTRGIEAVGSGYLVDLLAFHPDRPDRWALRCGIAEWLGAIAPQRCNPDPVRIWSSPVRWLQSGCDGLVMLSRDPVAVQRILYDCKVLRVAEDDEAELRRLMKERPLRCPRIVAEARRVG